MRIKINLLKEPDAEFPTVVKGNWVFVRVFSKPQYCVQVLTEKNQHCYPLTLQQYIRYMDCSELMTNPNRNTYEVMCYKTSTYKHDTDKSFAKKFWTYVSNFFIRRYQEASR